MQPLMILGFLAVGTDERGGEYDCSFMISFSPFGVHQKQIQYAVDQETKRFYNYHPTGRIVQQLQKVIVV